MIAVALLYLLLIWTLGFLSTPEILNPLSLFAREGGLCQLISRFIYFPAFPDACSLEWQQRSKVLAIFVVIPSILGAVWGRAVRNKIHVRLAGGLGFDLADIGSAWDVAFETIPSGSYILVTLKDGLSVCGYLEQGSAISNDVGFRDIFISETIGVEGQSPKVARGTWIAPDQIRTVELVSWRQSLQPEDQQRSAPHE